MQEKVAIARMLDIEYHPQDDNCVPSAVFTMPEVAAVGLAEAQAIRTDDYLLAALI